MFDLVVEFSDSWIQKSAPAPNSTYCAQLARAKYDTLDGLYLFSDTPRSVCGLRTRAACEDVYHGVSLLEAQYKRECILRQYLRLSEHGHPARWVVSTEQDTVFRPSTLDLLTQWLPPPRSAIASRPIIGAFFVASRACLDAAFATDAYVACKRSHEACRLRNKCRIRGLYNGALYNNDHLVQYCMLHMQRCAVHQPSRSSPSVSFFYNKFRRENVSGTAHLIHHAGTDTVAAAIDPTIGRGKRGVKFALRW